MKKTKSIIEYSSAEINKYFRNVLWAHGRLEEHERQHGLQIPNDTRLHSHVDSMKFIVLNYHKYREFAFEHLSPNS